MLFLIFTFSDINKIEDKRIFHGKQTQRLQLAPSKLQYNFRFLTFAEKRKIKKKRELDTYLPFTTLLAFHLNNFYPLSPQHQYCYQF